MYFLPMLKGWHGLPYSHIYLYNVKHTDLETAEVVCKCHLMVLYNALKLIVELKCLKKVN